VVFQVFRFVCAQNKEATKKKQGKKKKAVVVSVLSLVSCEQSRLNLREKNLKKREKTLNLSSLNELNSPWRRLNLYLLAAIFGCVLFFLSPFCFLLLCWLMGGPIESSEKASASIS
jgi:hypothetical protein